MASSANESYVAIINNGVNIANQCLAINISISAIINET